MMKTKKLFLAGLATAVIAIGIGIMVLSQRSPADRLVSSVDYSDGEVSFLVPNGNVDWNIHIAGRVMLDDFGGMSVHYLDDIDWENGRAYSFDVSDGHYTELSLTASQNNEKEIIIDLMQYLPDELKAMGDA